MATTLQVGATLKLTKKQKEANVFAAFLKFSPLFIGEQIQDWIQPEDDPPDILCTTSSGKKVGVELREWLHEREMTQGISYERRERSVMEALGDQGENPRKNVGWVWLYVKKAARIRNEDRRDFKSQVHLKIAEMDNILGNADSRRPHGLPSKDFSNYPKLAQYIDEIRCFQRKTMDSIPRQPWIYLHPHFNVYSPQTMLKALYEAIDDKRNYYKSCPGSLQGFYLLIHYDIGHHYNSPIETGTFKVEDAARLGKEHIGTNPGVFDKIFLYLAIQPGEKVFQLY